jgi:tetratricopeptide (TPR) repeat protein
MAIGLAACSLILLSARGQGTAAPERQVAADISAHHDEQALRLIAQLLPSSPRNIALWTLRGVALNDLGRTQESLASFRHALQIQGDFQPALEGAAQTAYLHGDPSAMRYIGKLLALDPSNQVANAMAGALAYDAHNCGQSADYFARSQAAVFRQQKALDEYADCLLKQQQSQQAVAVLTRAVALYPDSIELKYNLGVADIQNHQPAEAVAVLSPLASVKDSDLLNLLATAYEQASQPNDAFRVLESAIEINPAGQTNYLDLAILCLEHNQEERSVEAATAGIARIPKAASLYLIRGVANAQLARYEAAESDFVTAADLEPDQPHSTIAMSLLYSDRNQIEKEKNLLTAQLARTPNDAATNYLMADVLLRSGAVPGQPAFEEAKAHLQTSLAARPDSVEGQILMAKLLAQQDLFADALAHIDQALALDPRNQSALNRKFVLLHKLHRDDQAAEVLVQLKAVLNGDLTRENASTQMRMDATSAAK